MNVAPYRKVIVALLGALSIAVADGVFDSSDTVTVVIAVLTAAGVYRAPNAPVAERAPFRLD
jgi:hypothetical protein